jgi:hypothetical protein
MAHVLGRPVLMKKRGISQAQEVAYLIIQGCRAMVVALGLCRLKKNSNWFLTRTLQCGGAGGHASVRFPPNAGCRVYMPGASAARLLMFFIFIPQWWLTAWWEMALLRARGSQQPPEEPSPPVLRPSRQPAGPQDWSLRISGIRRFFSH